MELPVTRPVSPDLVPVMELHRNGDGFVSFHRKGSRWEDICSVRARDLLRMFPAFAAELFRDAYFSVNSFHRHAGGGGGPGGGLYRVHRSAESVRDLTSCFVDILTAMLWGSAPDRQLGLCGMRRRWARCQLPLCTFSQGKASGCSGF